jgi:hypothetical protein
MPETISPTEINDQNEEIIEQEKPRIVKSALTPIQSELMRLGPGL